MKPTNWKDFAELTGLAAIVGSLIFVGLQLKQSQDIALSQISQARTDSTIEMIVSSAENPLFISASAKRLDGRSESVTTEELVAISQYARALLYRYENQHFQYSNGFLAEERWQASKATIASFLSNDTLLPLRETYEADRARYSAGFQKVMDAQIAIIDGEIRGK